MLRQAGIEVQSGILEDQARQLNEAFITYVTRKRPFGLLKIAMTLDGKIATAAGESQWITSQESRAAVQELRHSVDAGGDRQRDLHQGPAADDRSDRIAPPPGTASRRPRSQTAHTGPGGLGCFSRISG